MSTCRRVKLDPYFTAYTEISSKYITVINVRAKTIKHLEGNTRINRMISAPWD